MQRRGNVLAAVLILTLLFVGTFLILAVRNLDAPVRVDYQKVLSNTQSIVSRLIATGSDALLKKGFSTNTEVWYCNQPLPPNATEIGESYAKELHDRIVDILPDDGSTVTVSIPSVVADVKDIDSIGLNITNFTVTITTNDENRSFDLSSSQGIDTNLAMYYQVLMKWMGCNAGNLTQRIRDVNVPKFCAFEACCCNKMPMDDGVKNKLIERYGLKEAEIRNATNQSIEVLNRLFAGADSCTSAPKTTEPNVVCTMNVSDSVFVLANDLFINYSEQSCDNPTCTINPIPTIRGALFNWSAPTLPALECPNYRVPLNVQTDVAADFGEPNNPPIPEGLRSKYYALSLQRKAGANVVITCMTKTNDVQDYVKPQVMQIRVRFNVKYFCETPIKPQETCTSGNCNCQQGGCGVPPEICCTDPILKLPPETNELCERIGPPPPCCPACIMPPVTCHCPNGQDIITINKTDGNCHAIAPPECEFECNAIGAGEGAPVIKCLDSTPAGYPCKGATNVCVAKYTCFGKDDCRATEFNPTARCDVCTLCGPVGACDTAPAQGSSCGNDPINSCVENLCNGGIGEGACTDKNVKPNACKEGTCTGVCDKNTGQCHDFSGTCKTPVCSIMKDSTCNSYDGTCKTIPFSNCCQGGTVECTGGKTCCSLTDTCKIAAECCPVQGC